MPRTYIFVLRTADRPGIVHQATGAILGVGGNIVESAQFSDPDSETFVMRCRFVTDQAPAEVEAALRTGLPADFEIRLRPEDVLPRALVMVSRHDHCLVDLLYRHRTGELGADVVVVVSNHRDCEPLVADHHVDFLHLPVSPETKSAQEDRLRDAIAERQIDLVVLARYMQILSPELCAELHGRVINIHHSFLPGFKGARPYHQAHDRGVKLIGATAHYVTADLDEGPIIEQDVIRVNHTHDVDALIRLGRDVERSVLARAVQAHAQERVVLIGHRTVVLP